MAAIEEAVELVLSIGQLLSAAVIEARFSLNGLGIHEALDRGEVPNEIGERELPGIGE
ncbi:MAG TPA: hypothetical protein VJH87_13460 [Vicinamibacteria bacterium]|nr:hypothetical protein [Vicinamibacteria bacterium]